MLLMGNLLYDVCRNTKWGGGLEKFAIGVLQLIWLPSWLLSTIGVLTYT